ncbi:MAG: hypothetical protein J5746_14545, partial [Victivallales bacterium]|nr:hypothetical protein [Victivallales bacterium]
HSYWNNAWADFGKERQVSNCFYFSLYELACSFGKAPMPGLNGLSYGPRDIISTGANIQHYTHDQNAQIPLMPLMPLNRCDFISVAADTYLAVADRLRADTRKLFGCDGIRLPPCMKQDGREYSVSWYRYTLCGSAYTGFMLALAWKYSRNERLLKEKLLPLLRDFVRFYAGLMSKDGNGIYHLDYTVPPEIFTVTKDDTCTLALLKPCMETLVEAHSLFHTEDEKEAALWNDMLDNYPPLARRPDGAWWCGPDIPYQHYMFGGHLFYPFFPTAVDTDRHAARKTLEYAENLAVETSHTDLPGKFHPYHSWAAYNFTATAIRLGDLKLGWNGMKRFIELFAKPNGLFIHNAVVCTDDISSAEKTFNEAPNHQVLNYNGAKKDTKFNYEDATPNKDSKKLTPPVIEGSSEFLLMAAETLLQSWGGIIRPFPCVPKNFSGSFRNFLAEGGFLVSAEMKNGVLAKVSIQAAQTGAFTLQLPHGQITRQLKTGQSFRWRNGIR